jgi:death on curing protein
MGKIRFLSLQAVLMIHETMISRYGGVSGIRDAGMLESALAVPRSGIGDEFFHKTVFEMAAAYVFHIVENHPFFDGNKRTGLASALTFLKINGVDILDKDRVFEYEILELSQGKRNKEALVQLFETLAGKSSN